MSRVVLQLALLAAVASNTACEAANRTESPAREARSSSLSPRSSEPRAPDPDDEYAAPRLRMVQTQLAARDIRNEHVLAAMRVVPRHEFVPKGWRFSAYEDSPLPIAREQTISQPYIVALMTQLAEVKKGDRVLEVGTGSGYQAAVLAEMGATVYSIEIIAKLSKDAAKVLDKLGYDNVHLRIGDGYRGWPEQAPFDSVIVTAAPPAIPEPLKQQLRVHGKLVIPVGKHLQNLIVVTRTESGFDEKNVVPVAFVPMTGEAQRDP